MAKCDLCGSDCSAADLTQLRDGYRVAGVVDICPACEKWASKIKSDMLSEIAPRLRAAIAERKGMPLAPAPTPRLSPWRRLVRSVKAMTTGAPHP